jgi:hypothetical protein
MAEDVVQTAGIRVIEGETTEDMADEIMVVVVVAVAVAVTVAVVVGITGEEEETAVTEEGDSTRQVLASPTD